MRLIENRLVGENVIEDAVLRNLVAERLGEFLDPKIMALIAATDPDETGIMSALLKWHAGSLECEVWIEAESHHEEPHPEDFECGEFHLVFKWRKSEREGDWHELTDVVQWADEGATHPFVCARPDRWELAIR
jgi:hypothetical protein